MSRILYAGTPEFAVPALEALLRAGHTVTAVYTQPDRPAGRGRNLQASPVKQCALDAGLPVMQPEHFRSAAELDAWRAFDADLAVVAAYGLLLPPAVLEAPRLGCINIHASLLPRWRGASPIQQAILAGDAQSGISLMKMDAGLDTGDVIAQRAVTIDSDWNAADLHDALGPLGADMIVEALRDIDTALLGAVAQDDALASYAPRLEKQQARVDWRKPAMQLEREIRAYNPWPVSFTALDGANLRLWQARLSDGEVGSHPPGHVVAHDRDGVYVACADGLLQITELQFAGRRRCSAGQTLAGTDLSGRRLGDAQ